MDVCHIIAHVDVNQFRSCRFHRVDAYLTNLLLLQKKKKRIIPNTNSYPVASTSQVTSNLPEQNTLRVFPYHHNDIEDGTLYSCALSSRISHQPTVFLQPIGFSKIPSIMQRRQPLIPETETRIHPQIDSRSNQIDHIRVPIELMLTDRIEDRISSSRQSTPLNFLNYKML